MLLGMILVYMYTFRSIRGIQLILGVGWERVSYPGPVQGNLTCKVKRTRPWEEEGVSPNPNKEKMGLFQSI